MCTKYKIQFSFVKYIPCCTLIIILHWEGFIVVIVVVSIVVYAVDEVSVAVILMEFLSILKVLNAPSSPNSTSSSKMLVSSSARSLLLILLNSEKISNSFQYSLFENTLNNPTLIENFHQNPIERTPLNYQN